MIWLKSLWNTCDVVSWLSNIQKLIQSVKYNIHGDDNVDHQSIDHPFSLFRLFLFNSQYSISFVCNIIFSSLFIYFISALDLITCLIRYLYKLCIEWTAVFFQIFTRPLRLHIGEFHNIFMVVLALFGTHAAKWR